VTNPHATLKLLYEQRDPLYTQLANLIMLTGKQSAHSLVLNLQDELKVFAET
jgi:shikimate kinase